MNHKSEGKWIEMDVVAYHSTCPSLSEGSEENDGIFIHCFRSLVRDLSNGSAEYEVAVLLTWLWYLIVRHLMSYFARFLFSLLLTIQLNVWRLHLLSVVNRFEYNLEIRKNIFLSMTNKMQRCIILSIAVTASGNSKQVWQIPDAACTDLSSWWWAGKPLEYYTTLHLVGHA